MKSMSEPKKNGAHRSRLVGIDLFSGAGGMSIGAKAAGIKTVLAVEKCPYAAATYKQNFPDTGVHVGDIREIRELPAKPKGNTQTVIYGGPPCQGFSTSNQRTRTGANPNNWLFQEFVRIVQLWEPDWVVMENVKGIVETEGGQFLDATIESLEKSGFAVDYRILNAVDFGVPQRRSRVFVVGSRNGERYEFPTPMSSDPTTVAEAIADLPTLGNGANRDTLPYRKLAPSTYARSLRGRKHTVSGNVVTRNAIHVLERYRHVPQGGNWESIPARLMKNYTDRSRCHTGIYRRLAEDMPADVIGNFRKNMLIHPTEDRGLSVREAARIQSVPDSFRFCGSIGFQQQQVGNMVPPLLSSAVFGELAQLCQH